VNVFRNGFANGKRSHFKLSSHIHLVIYKYFTLITSTWSDYICKGDNSNITPHCCSYHHTIYILHHSVNTPSIL